MEDRKMKLSAVILTAGSSSRMGGIDKILRPLSGKPVIAYTLEAFQKSALVEEIILVCRDEKKEALVYLCEQYQITKVKKWAAGGASRAESVMSGLKLVEDAGLVAVHDGARPFITPALIEKTAQAAMDKGAAAPFVPLVDTVKRIQDGFAVETIVRSQYQAAQTPQIFQTQLLKNAYQALKPGGAYTDDCSVVESFGSTIAVVPGDRKNMKLTTPVDFIFAEAIIQAEKNGETER